MNKPESVKDVWPHTETVLFLMDSEDCFGNQISEVMDEISGCKHLSNEDLHEGNDLSADFHHFGRDRIEDIKEIVPNSLLLLDCDLVIETGLKYYLKGMSIPKGSEVVVLMDDPSRADAEQQIDNIPRSIEFAYCKEDVLEEAERYFKTICPQCKGDLAKNWVRDWKQVVYQKVEN